MSRSSKYIGRQYGNLTIIEFVKKTSGNHLIYTCLCTCGTVKDIHLSNLQGGRTSSCGCLHRRIISETHRTHGESDTRLYTVWGNMKSRCENSNVDSYQYYGDKGISICKEWCDDFTTFKDWADSSGYAENLSIDRIDNDKGYLPENCRWVDGKTQSRNRDYAWFVTIGGVRRHAKDWCEINEINYKTAHARKSRGWSEVDAVTIPTKSILSYKDSINAERLAEGMEREKDAD